jgi:hypothetical protein
LSSFVNNVRRGVWVPAFAGTTPVYCGVTLRVARSMTNVPRFTERRQQRAVGVLRMAQPWKARAGMTASNP